jgi:esterase
MPPQVPLSSLAATRVAATDHPTRHLVMLHGIYGRGRNWQAIARGIVAATPEYACWLVDLPHHGDSGPGTHGDTIVGLAADVDDWLASQHLTLDVVLGHSYGGKVALAIAQRRRADALQLWIIDSTPEVKPASGSAWRMLDIIRALPRRFSTRDEVIKAIVDGGFPLGVAQWMSTNLARDADGFVWRLDFDVMERLLQDFFTTDLWSLVEDPAPRHDLHFLKASESSAISPEAVRRISAAAGDGVHLHELQGGHWIHAEAPDVVTALIVDHLPRT